MNNGFNISTGCKLKKYRFNHLLAPFASIPSIGTITKRIKETTKAGITSLINTSVLINVINIMIDIAKTVKIKCLVKKK